MCQRSLPFTITIRRGDSSQLRVADPRPVAYLGVVDARLGYARMRVLLVILLVPVISLTDDIARCTAPRDAERALRLHDLLDGTQPTAALLPSAMAWMDALSVVLRSGPSRPVEQDAKLTALLQGTRLPIDSRPPPASRRSL